MDQKAKLYSIFVTIVAVVLAIVVVMKRSELKKTQGTLAETMKSLETSEAAVIQKDGTIAQLNSDVGRYRQAAEKVQAEKDGLLKQMQLDAIKRAKEAASKPKSSSTKSTTPAKTSTTRK